MSLRYKGAVISATPPTTTGGESGVASGSWTLEQQFQAQGAGNWPEPFVAKYIEDVFSTYLYTGNGSSQTITNGIDLSTKGGLVWAKNRSFAGYDHVLTDTIRGAGNILSSNNTAASQSLSNTLTAFGSTGFTLGSDPYGIINYSGQTYASWTFRKQPKFFDVVTYTGNGSTLTISHNLGSVPGCIIVKNTSSTMSWVVYHRSNGNDKVMYLNGTQAVSTDANVWNSYTPTSTNFQVGGSSFSNSNGDTYVAYLFAHNAGGFGLTGTDNVISCGSFTDTTTVNLGYEPQWVLFKKSSSSSIGDWFIADNMRGFSETSINTLSANTSSAEASYSGTGCVLTSTGFTYNTGLAGSGTFIYIAIRRGPMKVPTSGTSVFTPIARTGTGANATVSGVGFPPDLFIGQIRGTAGYWNGAVDRLRGVTKRLVTSQTNAEDTTTDAVTSFTMDGSTLGIDSNGFVNESGKTYIEWNFQRAPSFFDEVCYTGTGTGTVTHNLGVAPELIIVKNRSSAGYDWKTLITSPTAGTLNLNTTDALNTADNKYYFGNGSSYIAPTSTVFSVYNNYNVGVSGQTYVAYLFATCAGVSKVGSYTGNGTTQTINCGFTGGARFVLIKRTDSTGDWYVYDTARGMTTLIDPYLLLNSTAAESATLGSVTTVSTGFAVNASILAAINTNGASYIFLAIA